MQEITQTSEKCEGQQTLRIFEWCEMRHECCFISSVTVLWRRSRARAASHRSMSLDFMMWFLPAVTLHGPKGKSCLLLLKPCDIIVDREANMNCRRDQSQIFSHTDSVSTHEGGVKKSFHQCIAIHFIPGQCRFRKSWNRLFPLWWSPTPVEALWVLCGGIRVVRWPHLTKQCLMFYVLGSICSKPNQIMNTTIYQISEGAWINCISVIYA